MGREVTLPSGSADLVAVELTGQPVFIEVKLERNPEARRAVVAQVLSYAAGVYGLDTEGFESRVLGRHLRDRGYSSIAEAVAENDELAALQPEAFRENLASCLATGTARLVLVLDAAPRELMALAGYLEAVSERLTVDLIAVSMYEVGERKVLVPRRVDPGHEREERVVGIVKRSSTTAEYIEGAGDFVALIDVLPPEKRDGLRQVASWAEQLEREGLARLMTTKGSSFTGLRVRLLDEDGGPVTLWGHDGAKMEIWGSVLHRRAPASVSRVGAELAPKELRTNASTSTREITTELLDALTGAYREATRP